MLFLWVIISSNPPTMDGFEFYSFAFQSVFWTMAFVLSDDEILSRLRKEIEEELGPPGKGTTILFALCFSVMNVVFIYVTSQSWMSWIWLLRDFDDSHTWSSVSLKPCGWGVQVLWSEPVRKDTKLKFVIPDPSAHLSSLYHSFIWLITSRTTPFLRGIFCWCPRTGPTEIPNTSQIQTNSIPWVCDTQT